MMLVLHVKLTSKYAAVTHVFAATTHYLYRPAESEERVDRISHKTSIHSVGWRSLNNPRMF